LDGSLIGEFYADPNDGALGERLRRGETEALSWLVNFPSPPVEKTWLIEEGVGKEASETFTGPEAKITGTLLMSLTANKMWGPAL
jgi:hypothetical protein